MNLLLGGHYATETFGVNALAGHLSRRFKLPWGFLDFPTGL
jgi:putative NIF3 family GTP cyclohydrolase 1 type 2